MTDRSWIAKFERKTDTFDQCGSEHATMRLAARCGIDVAETRLVEVGATESSIGQEVRPLVWAALYADGSLPQ